MGEITTAPPPPVADDDGWTARDWEALLLSIRYKHCTPFLGAGACAGVLPLGAEIARKWADEYGYPFADVGNLPRVAHYVAIEGGPHTPYFRIMDEFGKVAPPNAADPNEPHRVLASLNLPVYITTNYDNFMTRALERDVPPRRPQRQRCEWFKARRRELVRRDVRGDENVYTPSADEPLVFHLHGTLDSRESMVLTEDDYLDFLLFTAEVPDLIPPRVQQAFSEDCLMFIGYSLDDINFKVLFRKLATYMQRAESARHVSVQLAPRPNESTEEQKASVARQRAYLERRFDLQRVKVYWGTAQQFAAELRRRWEGL